MELSVWEVVEYRSGLDCLFGMGYQGQGGVKRGRWVSDVGGMDGR